ncbi:hypothetical protein D8B26_008318 [Coccidioides posadasii str. Silveira]|uniref:Uncharacterized protein n=1 Tax=Coccidioides posadasii (strain RMSCC 757 / Silveira) TaxID=443226 RepID=E9DGW0_COCPS|nr:conserved hypothetical protein [Coccidioides posadasii str. Silveira]QVM13712.1 hypothetical protein D8B26_008318 [Coccidioides posadasii str. Silveira]
MEANNQNQNKKRYLSSKGEQAGLSVLIQKGKQTRSGSVEVVYSPKIPGGHERGKQCGVQSLEPWTLYEEQEKYDEFTMIYVFSYSKTQYSQTLGMGYQRKDIRSDRDRI